MPVADKSESAVVVPKGVTVTFEGDMVKVKGPKGEMARRFSHANLKVIKGDGNITVTCVLPLRAEKALVGTWAAHLKNMMDGVTSGHEYKMKIVYAHFPIKVNVKDGKVQIDNFLGERYPRFASIKGKTAVKVQGEFIVLTGINIEEVSQTAANIEQATTVRGYDTRIFQDGIYIIQKGV